MTSVSPAIAVSDSSCTELRTGVWYGDEKFTVRFPPEWSLVVQWPRTPPALTETQIVQSMERPVGQKPIRELCHGKVRPLVIVDDLHRPTPAYRVLPLVLRQFQDAGIPPRAVRILVATGTHSLPSKDSVVKKVGAAAAAECEIIIHNPNLRCTKVAKTSSGTPVFVNDEVMASDFVIGIGGVYPNATAGFGGGSKLALGVLGFQSIMQLHYRHQSMGWGRLGTRHAFRRDLDEIARTINLRTMVCVHIDLMRDVTRLTCGDPSVFYNAEVEFARKTYSTPPPGDADIVISNAYPSDLSVTQVHMKGLGPLLGCAPGASRIVLASCPEGFGHHGVFPVVNRPKYYRLLHIARRLATTNSRDLLRRIAARTRVESVKRNPIRLYRPHHAGDLPSRSAQFHITNSWAEIINAVRGEHPGKHHLQAVVYPSGSMQVLESSEVSEFSEVNQ